MLQKLTCQKQAFMLPDGLHYLNCAYMSPRSRRVQEAGLSGVRRRSNPATRTADDFFDDVDEIRRLCSDELVWHASGRGPRDGALSTQTCPSLFPTNHRARSPHCPAVYSTI